MPFTGKATVFFSDTFGNGSTIGSATPALPTPNSASYQESSSKAWVPNPPTIASGDLKFGMGSSTSGGAELQALFTTNPVSLVAVGDFARLTMTFTNTTGLMTASCLLGFGLYNGNQVQPIAGGLAGTAVNSVADHVSGGVQLWQGYWGQLAFTGGSTRMVLRLPQTLGVDNRNQNLTSTGSGSLSYGTPGGTTIGTASTTPSVALVSGQTYTVVLTIQLTDVNTLAITNTYYNGTDTNSVPLTTFGASASGTSYATATFDGLAIGWRATGANTGNTIDISSITVDGSTTVISSPPTITQEPVDTTVGTGGSVPFTVAADGVNVTYQWRRFGTNLLNVGNISGATSPMLVVNNASATDGASGANGYYCVVSGAGNYSTNSTTNSLTLVPARNLVWNGGGNVWDVNTSQSWNDGANLATFNYGDSVTFDDTGAGNPLVTLTGNFLSASKWLISGSTAYAFSGAGSFAGTGSLIFNSGAGGSIQLNVPNKHTGGTIISNSNPSLNIFVQQYQVLGTGPLTLAKPGMMEIVPVGNANLGIAGDVAVNDDFTIQFDGSGSFAGVFLGKISGVSGKTLTLNPQVEGNTNRFRFYGANFVCDANIAVDPNGSPVTVAQYNGVTMAPYHSAPDSQTYNGTISGSGGIIQRASGVTTLNGANTYTGGTTVTTGAIGIGNNAALGTGVINVAPELGSAPGSGAYFASGGARTVANLIQYPDGITNQTLIVGGTNNITFSGAMNLAGTLDGLGTNRTIQVTNTAATTFSGVISDSGTASGLNKTGIGALYLNGANTYTGPTVVSAGRLTGSGTIAGAVAVQTNSAIGGGSAAGIGTLTVGGDLNFTNGNVFIRVNKTLSPAQSNDVVAVNGALAFTGTTGMVTVTNFGAAPVVVGDTFKIFNKALTGGNTVTITGAGMNWGNNLSTDGSITALSVVSTVATNSTNMTFSVSGTNLSLTWPGDHLGWYVQMQTNNLTNSAWVDVTNSSTVTNVLIPINPNQPKAFFRMSLQP